MVAEKLETALKAAEKAERLAEMSLEDQKKSQEEAEMRRSLHCIEYVAHKTLKAASKAEKKLASKETWGIPVWGGSTKEREEEISC